MGIVCSVCTYVAWGLEVIDETQTGSHVSLKRSRNQSQKQAGFLCLPFLLVGGGYPVS